MLYFAGYLLAALFLWFALWGQILDRLISKAGFSGKVYRWLMGLSAFSFVPIAVVIAAAAVFGRESEPDKGLAMLSGLLMGLWLIINWLILMILAWWPWPSLKKAK